MAPEGSNPVSPGRSPGIENVSQSLGENVSMKQPVLVKINYADNPMAFAQAGPFAKTATGCLLLGPAPLFSKKSGLKYI
jgi:hypothetical protein